MKLFELKRSASFHMEAKASARGGLKCIQVENRELAEKAVFKVLQIEVSYIFDSPDSTLSDCSVQEFKTHCCCSWIVFTFHINCL